MAYSPTRADATPMAADMVARLSTALGITVPTNDRIVALCDDILCSSGFQDQSATIGSAGTSASTSFVDVAGWSSWTFNAPVAKKYLVVVDIGAYLTARGAGQGFIDFQLVVGATSFAPADAVLWFNTVNTVLYKTFRVPVPMAAGNNTIKLQWKVRIATDTAATDGASTPRTFTVIG